MREDDLDRLRLITDLRELGLSLVEITNDAGSSVYGSAANPADVQSITLTTPITPPTAPTAAVAKPAEVKQAVTGYGSADKKQVQEMVRAERMVRDEEIEHELETYNELLGRPGELGAALLIEIDDPAVRAVRLREWMGLPERLYVRTASGRKVRASYDARQVGEDRLSSVQYLKFDTGGEVPVAVGADHPRLTAEVELTPEQRRALVEAAVKLVPAGSSRRPSACSTSAVQLSTQSPVLT